jgi:hypothetical protein
MISEMIISIYQNAGFDLQNNIIINLIVIQNLTINMQLTEGIDSTKTKRIKQLVSLVFWQQTTDSKQNPTSCDLF